MAKVNNIHWVIINIFFEYVIIEQQVRWFKLGDIFENLLHVRKIRIRRVNYVLICIISSESSNNVALLPFLMKYFSQIAGPLLTEDIII
jgi:hypothetical protein